MKKACLFVVAALLILFVASVTWAEPVVKQIYYQRKAALTFPQVYTIRFSLWDAESGGSAPLWEEEKKINLTTSTLKTYLGDVNSLDGVDFSQQLYFAIQ